MELTKKEKARRSLLRYWCFRKQREAISEVEADVPEELKADLLKIKKDDLFQGWKDFAETWDINLIEGEIKVYLRDFGVNAEWEAAIAREARAMPKVKKKKKGLFRK